MNFADLHCHLHFRSQYWMYLRRELPKIKPIYHPWTVVADNRRARARGGRANRYVQCDMVKSWNSGTRLVFNALYPLERGFVVVNANPGDPPTRSVLEHIINLIADEDLNLRDFIQALYMNLPRRMIDFLQSNEYDYFKFLKEEYNFLVDHEGKTMRSEIFVHGARQLFTRRRRLRRKQGDYYDAVGIYRIPKNKIELEQILTSPENAIIVPLTIEGIHGVGSTDFEGPNGSFDSVGFRQRITELKSWSYPIFFITFGHHFHNALCGHAHSVPSPIDEVLDQRHGMNAGLYPHGEAVLRHLLSIDNQNQDSLVADGYRIYIDVKHMAAKARKDFYQKIIEPRWQANDPIPFIASHCGYAGAKTLDALIAAADAGKEKNDYRLPASNPTYYGWNINMCDEDIKWIFLCGGLFGLSFDQRILGVHHKKSQQARNSLQALYDNIIAVLNVIYNDPNIPANRKIKVWAMLSIGTDFEGYIDPIDDYPTFIQFADFKTALLEKIIREKDAPSAPACLKSFNTSFTPEKAVDMLCYDNALTFVRRWYRD